MSILLSARLRVETRALHAAAEATPFMALLLSGAMGRRAYRALLVDMLAIYAALEPALARHAGHRAIAPLGVDALSRTRSLKADLATLEVADAPADVPRHAGRRLADRIVHLAGSQPERLAAHAYVRYLGDLSGGQLLRRIVARSPGLADVGTAFYEFGAAGSPHALAQRLRAGLDRVPVGDAEAIVDEAKLAFDGHRELFVELGAVTADPPAPAADA